MAGDRTYSAIGPLIRRPRKSYAIARQVILARDVGHILLDSSNADAECSYVARGPAFLGGYRLPGPVRAASIGDCLLPTGDRLLPLDRLWSAAGLQRYLDGRPPDPAHVFRRLVAVLSHCVAFSGCPAAPALTAVGAFN
jgi:hypothetical protein